MRRLEIEPLDKSRWERIERSLRDRLEHEHAAPNLLPNPSRMSRMRPIGAIMVAGAAAAVIGAIAWEALRPSVHDKASTSVTRVETEGMPTHVEFGESSIEVAAHSSARIEGTDATGITVSLDHGAVECEVPPRNGRPPFMVHAGAVNVRVVGTHFRVERDASAAEGAAHVSVDHGAVEVESHGTTSLVRAGSSWPVVAVQTETIQTSPPQPEPPPSTIKPTTSVATPTASTVSSPPASSPRERYEHALTLEATRPDEALAVYRELALGDGSWAMNALYAEGRLELERGNKDLARKSLEEYLKRYPTGPNANDARELTAKLK